jgi:mycothiol synthase
VAEHQRWATTYFTCQIFREENAKTGRNEGYTDPVATHPEYQGRGLAKALFLTGLRLLRERGMETAVMGTSSENEKMQRAAKAVGFRVESSTVWFAKPV